MFGYVCKYTPVEMFESFGIDIERIEPNVVNFCQADMLMHPNICSYSKGVLEAAEQNRYEGIILTTCCDSTRRLYDVLTEKYPDKFIYLLDFPRKVNDLAIKLYEQSIVEMMKAYEAFSGKPFDIDRFHQVCELKRQAFKREKSEKEREGNPEKSPIKIGIMGARSHPSVVKLLEKANVELVFNLTCTGLERHFSKEQTSSLYQYSGALLRQFPCMRMEDISEREQTLKAFEEDLSGIVYHTVQFCDNYSYDYVQMKETFNKPILKIETDYTMQSAGQLRTRIEAFVESLEVTAHVARQRQKKHKGGNEKMYVLGIDSGSTSTNAVIMNEKKEIIAFDVVRTGAKSGESAERVLKSVLEKAKLQKNDLEMIVSTGYGRVSIPFADMNVTEISCHGKGANYFNPQIRTILDIGGQDSKVIKLNDRGEVTDFVMNDKCAAGTGRFLELMARSLEMEISELGPASMKWKENVSISSMCSVFAESEVISLIALNKDKSDIAHGVHQSVASKAFSLIKRVGLGGEYMMTGGVAKNPGVVLAVEEKIGEKLFIADEPEIVGAVGAALFGL